jgi:hypothetical protein
MKKLENLNNNSWVLIAALFALLLYACSLQSCSSTQYSCYENIECNFSKPRLPKY